MRSDEHVEVDHSDHVEVAVPLLDDTERADRGEVEDQLAGAGAEKQNLAVLDRRLERGADRDDADVIESEHDAGRRDRDVGIHADEGDAATGPGPAGLAAGSLPANDCTVCTHPKAAEIDAGLLGGTPVRAIAETFGLSRSAVGRHRLNHLSAEAAIESDDPGERRPLRIVDVHVQLASLADRLEKVVELAARTRKATAAIGATRELRQTLVAIAELQTNPDLQRAASKKQLEEWIDRASVDVLVRMFDFILDAFHIGARDTNPHFIGVAGERARVVSGLMADCLREVYDRGVHAHFGDVDTGRARALIEQDALDRAHRMEEEVRRRVEVELRRREAQARPALEARPPLAIEGGAWTL